MIELEAYAKLNLSLELPDVERTDGYHEINTVLQTVSLADRLSFDRSSEVLISSDDPSWRAEDSLVSKALVLMQKEVATEEGAVIYVEKNIPLSSGLGGDSACAAATIVGLNKLWGAKMNSSELMMLASQLGSDVPFFIHGGTQHAKGRGEILTPVETPKDVKFILLHPDVAVPSGKTKLLYDSITPADMSDGDLTDTLVWGLDSGGSLKDFALTNAFDRAAGNVFTGLESIRHQFSVISSRQVFLSGAGPSLFAVFGMDEDVSGVLDDLAENGYRAWELTCIGRRSVF